MTSTVLPRPLSVWARLAVWLGFLAVLSALVAPASLLAEEVRTGKLGGLCSVNPASASNPDAGDESTPSGGSHCDWCLSIGLAPPPLLASTFRPAAQSEGVVQADFPAVMAASVTGLPFSRGPPFI